MADAKVISGIDPEMKLTGSSVPVNLSLWFKNAVVWARKII
jgi:hypothetical protein